MSDLTPGSGAEAAEGEETLLDASKLEEQWHQYAELFERLLRDDEREELRRTAAALSPGDLSESLRYLGVDDTARVLQLLPPDPEWARRFDPVRLGPSPHPAGRKRHEAQRAVVARDQQITDRRVDVRVQHQTLLTRFTRFDGGAASDRHRWNTA